MEGLSGKPIVLELVALTVGSGRGSVERDAESTGHESWSPARAGEFD